MADVTLNVPWIRQETDFLCGPAVLQMVLSGRGHLPPRPTPSWQQQLWTHVQAQSTGGRSPSRQPTGVGNIGCPPFRGQKCERCTGIPEPRCWCTTPAALSKVLNLQSPATPMSVRRCVDEQEATEQIVASIDASVAGVALVYGWLHWVVVRGYMENGPAAVFPPKPIAGKSINGMYLRDPQSATALQFVGIKAWFDDYLRSVPCGTFRNDYVVVCAAGT